MEKIDVSAHTPIVEADLTPDTMLSASAQYQGDKGRTHFGAPFAADAGDAGLPRSFFLGDANHRQKKDLSQYTLGLTQRLAGAWSLKAAYSHIETGNAIQNYSYAYGGLDPVTGDGLTLSRMRTFNRDTPRHSLRLAAQYQVPDTGWSAGGNVAATSGTYSTGTWPVPYTMRQGTLVLIGLNAKYQITPQAEVQLGVSNLTDRRYRNLDFLTGAPFGEPRKFTANLKYRF